MMPVFEYACRAGHKSPYLVWHGERKPKSIKCVRCDRRAVAVVSRFCMAKATKATQAECKTHDQYYESDETQQQLKDGVLIHESEILADAGRGKPMARADMDELKQELNWDGR